MSDRYYSPLEDLEKLFKTHEMDIWEQLAFLDVMYVETAEKAGLSAESFAESLENMKFVFKGFRFLKGMSIQEIEEKLNE